MRTAALALAALSTTAACQPVGVPGATALRSSWMFGVERMRDDPEPRLPYTNQFIADLAAMPSVQVVYVGDGNMFPFNAWQGGKVLVSPWLRGEGNCMNIAYTVFQSGQQQALFGVAVPPMPAGFEPDSACVDRAASQFYRALVLQGL
ncbi:MAG TPA: hypothetical protein VFE12_18240 [Acetobacteraceae bacterium]|jgi:hypothetical protein|nr:hypothetical protein [Acetobacteraceae bacterium]